MSGWEFVADFGTAQVDVAQPTTQEGGDAWWEISYGADTPVLITEQVPDGYRLIDVRCQWSPDDMTVAPLPMTRDVNTISWTAPVGTWFEHGFWCIFVNVVDGDNASPTLPPTDTASGSAAHGSDAWRLVLVGLAALIVGILVVRPRPAARSRT